MSWKTPITLLVLLGILLGAAYYGWSTVLGPEEEKKDDTASPPADNTCDEVVRWKKGQRVKAADVRVNIYNGGLVSGLAGETLDALTAKGFRPGNATNAPESLSTPNVAIITADPESPEVRLVRIQFRGAVQIIDDDLGRGIDVLVGDDFRAVKPVTKTQIVLRKNIKGCAAKP